MPPPARAGFLVAPALPYDPIHSTAWKGRSANFTCRGSREHILADFDELLHATEWLAEERLGYRKALRNYVERFLRLHGGNNAATFTIDSVHSEFV